jgi:hypothetical protein
MNAANCLTFISYLAHVGQLPRLRPSLVRIVSSRANVTELPWAVEAPKVMRTRCSQAFLRGARTDCY